MAKKIIRENKFDGCNCQKCSFYKGTLVKPFGSITSDIYVIAEKLGATEAEVGIGLVGRSGQIFRNTLKELNLDIDNFYLDNTNLCYTEGNKTPTALQANYCGNHIYPLIRAINPKLIVLLGKVPARFIFQTNKINDKRGIIVRKDGYNYLYTYHPAACLYNPNLLAAFKNDLNKINRYLNYLNSERDYLYCLTEKDLQKAKEILQQQKVVLVSFDVEANHVNIHQDFKLLSISFSYAKGKAIGIPLFHPQNKLVKECIELCTWALENEDIKKVTHSKFDYSAIKKVFNIEIKKIISDTLLMQYLLDENRQGNEYGLKKLAWEYLEYGGFKLIGDDYTYENLEDVLDYNMSDTDTTLQLFHILHKKLKEEDLSFLNYRIEAPASLAVADMELNGVKIDVVYLEKLSKEYEKRLIDFHKELLDFSGVPEGINLNSYQQLGKLFFEIWNFPIIKVTDKGNISTDESVLSELAEKHEFPAKLQEYRRLTKFKATYIDFFLENQCNGYIYPNYLMFVTRTGRLTERLMLIPKKDKDIRKAFISRFENGKLLELDYKQMEIRMFANVTKDKNLIEMLQDGVDVHAWAATQVFNIKEEDVTEEIRNDVKAFDFGILYGKEKWSLSKDLNISEGKAQKIIDKILNSFPQVREWIAKIPLIIKTQGYLKNIFNRRRRFLDYNELDFIAQQEAIRQGRNFPIQSCHDLTFLALIKCNKYIKENNLKSKITMENHDSLLFDCHSKEIDIIAKNCKTIMETLPFDILIVPLLVDIKVGNNWGEMEKYDK